MNCHFKNKKNQLLVVPLLAATLALGACGGNDSDDGGVSNNGTTAVGNKAVIATAASDFTSGAIDIFDTTDPFAGQTGLNAGVSDVIVRSFEDSYFVIRRYESDTITAYSSADTVTPRFEASTNSDEEAVSSNPHDLVFVNAQKAYLLRYGSPLVWIVNPSVTDPSLFKIGEIDLSAYDADGTPQIDRGVIVGDRLFVFMQRLDESFVPNRPGMVAVIDTETDTEIDTQSAGPQNGIELLAVNPGDLSLDTASDTILIAAAGDHGNLDIGGNRPSALTGGLLTVDAVDFSTSILIDDTESTGRIIAVEVVDTDTAYLITSDARNSASLDRINPVTGAIEAVGIAGLAGVDLRDIAVGPEGNLWVAVADTANPRIVVVNPADNSLVTDNINPLLNPINIVFTQ